MGRKGKEFSQATKEFVIRRANGKDERTGQPLIDPHFHHKLPIYYARNHAPDISPDALKSSDNCEVVNYDTHKEIHRDFDHGEAWFMIVWFRAIQRGFGL